jgi:hypothetical protein
MLDFAWERCFVILAGDGRQLIVLVARHRFGQKSRPADADDGTAPLGLEGGHPAAAVAVSHWVVRRGVLDGGR